jgi:hypothetical protein
MVNKKNWLGILAIGLVFGMMIVGCDPESGSTGSGSASWPNNLSGTKWTNSLAGVSGNTLEFKTNNTCDIDGDIFPLVSAVENGKIVVKYRDENETLCASYSINGNTLTFTSPSNKLIASETTWTKDGASNNNNNTVSISGTPTVGEKLTATSTGNLTGDFSWAYAEEKEGYAWYVLNNVETSGQNKSELIIPDNQGGNNFKVGYYIKASRGNEYSGSGNYAYDIIGPIQAAGGNNGGGSASWPNNLKGTKWTYLPQGVIGGFLEFKTDNTCDADGEIVPLVSAVENGEIVVTYRRENETLCQSYSISGNTLTLTSPSNKLIARQTTWRKVE